MLTGNLQIKNDTYYAVINYKQGEKYKQKWISTKLKTTGNKRRATEFLNSVIEKYSEMDLKKKMWNIKFTDYAQKWLENKKGTFEQCTWDGYFNSVEKHIIPYFEKLNLYIKDIKPMHISNITIINFVMEDVIIRVDFRCVHLKLKGLFLNVY